MFDALLRHFDAAFECFASPLNCRYGRYCSAFPDTDRCFGALGSFFDFHPTRGSYQANPPFVPTIISSMSAHMGQLLASPEAEALCFVVIVPAWEHSAGWQALCAHPHLRHHERIGQADHGYCEGRQHLRKTRFRIASFDTSVFFLQNDPGADAWPVTPEKIEDLRRAFASKQALEASAVAAPASASDSSTAQTTTTTAAEPPAAPPPKKLKKQLHLIKNEKGHGNGGGGGPGSSSFLFSRLPHSGSSGGPRGKGKKRKGKNERKKKRDSGGKRISK